MNALAWLFMLGSVYAFLEAWVAHVEIDREWDQKIHRVTVYYLTAATIAAIISLTFFIL